MDMDLVNAAVGLKQAQNTSNIQMAVAKKVMDADRMNGDAAIKLLNAATSGVAAKGDAMAAAATGLGGEIDAYG